ncbi:hypothetical protein HanIR_Chr11g0544181 [Helianthus annuus]|nr:hypothetical protein HanIR_Chr11g0544181 [Helianthus annuus]
MCIDSAEYRYKMVQYELPLKLSDKYSLSCVFCFLCVFYSLSVLSSVVPFI